MRTNHIFEIIRPGHDSHGDEKVIFGTLEEVAKARAEFEAFVESIGGTCLLRLIGTRTDGVLTPCVPVAALPWWAAEQLGKKTAKRSRACRHDFSDGDVCSKCDAVRRSA